MTAGARGAVTEEPGAEWRKRSGGVTDGPGALVAPGPAAQLSCSRSTWSFHSRLIARHASSDLPRRQ
ncbi:hypothetical protein GCM10010275_65090 [Streptomyces litmocidini]|nr:hypothetical protein GCM10010275_65090 [Streptomyces litmocidini]